MQGVEVCLDADVAAPECCGRLVFSEAVIGAWFLRHTFLRHLCRGGPNLLLFAALASLFFNDDGVRGEVVQCFMRRLLCFFRSLSWSSCSPRECHAGSGSASWWVAWSSSVRRRFFFVGICLVCWQVWCCAWLQFSLL